MKPFPLCPLVFVGLGLLSKTALICISLAAVQPAQAANALARERIDFDADWRFHPGDPSELDEKSLLYATIKPWILPSGNAFRTTPAVRPTGTPPGENVVFAQADFQDQGWSAVTLPHDWGVTRGFNEDAPGQTGKLACWGAGWYRKHFDLAPADKQKQIFLDVDGAMSYATVWCNGRFVGGWPYGYASWRVDLTPYVKVGAGNVLAIRVCNPGDSSRWYPGAGIYRNVWLVKTRPEHVAQWGTSVTTSDVSTMSATVNVRIQVDNPTGDSVRLFTQIFPMGPDGTPKGAPVAVSTTTANSAFSKTGVFDMTLRVPNPKLWSVETPNLYCAVTGIARNDDVLDRYETVFGIRVAEFQADGGFFLNGRHVPIKGVCLHHDLGALGAAFNMRAAERRLMMLKEMGCNAIRTAHNPDAPEFLDLCDRMGFLVMDEFSDTWTIAKKPNGYAKLFKDWHEADLRAMIRRDRNHPSVIFWSIGNEVPEQLNPKGPEIAKALSAIVRSEDPTRLIAAGCDQIKAGANGFQKALTIFGYNYKPGEYKKVHEINPTLPIFGSETASTVSSRGEYAFPVSNNKADGKIGFQMSSYDLYAPAWATAPDTEFKGQDENPFVAGEFVWTGFDYLGEPTPFNTDLTVLSNFHTPEEKARAEKELKELGKIKSPSRSSYFGIIDLAGFKKDRFYLYQSRWRPELPMAHILPHWTWPGREGELTPVHVYTSGDEAELFLNGKSLGTKKKAPFEYRLRWDDVKYAPGTLNVVARKNGRDWAADTVVTAGSAAKVVLVAAPDAIKADGRDLLFVTATVVDKRGVLVPNAQNLISFSVDGPAQIVATDNGDATDLKPFTTAARNAFHGLALAILRPQTGGGRIAVKAMTDGLPDSELIVQSAPVK